MLYFEDKMKQLLNTDLNSLNSEKTDKYKEDLDNMLSKTTTKLNEINFSLNKLREQRDSLNPKDINQLNSIKKQIELIMPLFHKLELYQDDITKKLSLLNNIDNKVSIFSTLGRMSSQLIKRIKTQKSEEPEILKELDPYSDEISDTPHRSSLGTTTTADSSMGYESPRSVNEITIEDIYSDETLSQPNTKPKR